MIQIIIGFIVICIILGLIGMFFEWAKEHIGIVITVVVLIATFLVFSWPGILILLLLAAIVLVIATIIQSVEDHDKSVKETALINQKTKEDEMKHVNDHALLKELQENCTELGYMSESRWKKQLTNYVSKQYSKSFETVTSNFTKQCEDQYFTNNPAWFEPYKKYAASKASVTARKLLQEVRCDEIKKTHKTKDLTLIENKLIEGTQAVSRDVPALFTRAQTDDGEDIFAPTKYLRHLYESNASGNDDYSMHKQEFNFDDL